jgi:MFS transporter, ACDE family, multidrug resistance protein
VRSRDSPAHVRRSWPLFAGGFLGPFGATMVTPMLPELGVGLKTSLGTAAWALTAYLVPCSALMMVSGTFGDRWGRARTVRVAYLVYAAASLGCALASSPAAFLAARAAQGSASAFTSPLLVASISDAVAPGALGRALGMFGSWQAAGQAFAPLVGGAAAALDYRWAFVVCALAAAGLARMPTPEAPNGVRRGRTGHWRALANRRLVVSCAIAFCFYLATSGLQLLVALRAVDRFGLGPDTRGLVVATFGLAGLLTGSQLGRLADRLGVQLLGLGALACVGVCVLVAGMVPLLLLLVIVVAAAGSASTASRVVVNALALRSTPTNSGGAASMTLAWQFSGAALAPLVLLPVYTWRPLTAFAVATAVTAAALLLVTVAVDTTDPDLAATIPEPSRPRHLHRR